MTNRAETVDFKAGERNVFLHILTACNLSCSHCYINQAQHGTNMLSRERMKAWIRLFADERKQSNIVFLGGEPTLHPDLACGLEEARRCGYRVTVDSNGYLFHDFLERVPPELVDFLSFSLDGPDAEVNDPIRGAGVFEVCTANMQRAVSRGFNVSCIYTVSSRNIEHLKRMAPLLTRLGIKRFFIQVIGLRGKSAAAARPPEQGQPLQVDPDRWLEIVPAAAERIAEAGIEVVYPKVFLAPAEPFECAGNVAENFFIFPNGRVYQCPLCEDYPLHSYEIVDDKLVRLEGLTEERIFPLDIAEGCVMNRLLQPDTIHYQPDGTPLHRISCCLLKQRIGVE